MHLEEDLPLRTETTIFFFAIGVSMLLNIKHIKNDYSSVDAHGRPSRPVPSRENITIQTSPKIDVQKRESRHCWPTMKQAFHVEVIRGSESETLYHRDDALLYIAYVMLIWAAPIPAEGGTAVWGHS